MVPTPGSPNPNGETQSLFLRRLSLKEASPGPRVGGYPSVTPLFLASVGPQSQGEIQFPAPRTSSFLAESSVIPAREEWLRPEAQIVTQDGKRGYQRDRTMDSTPDTTCGVPKDGEEGLPGTETMVKLLGVTMLLPEVPAQRQKER